MLRHRESAGSIARTPHPALRATPGGEEGAVLSALPPSLHPDGASPP